MTLSGILLKVTFIASLALGYFMWFLKDNPDIKMILIIYVINKGINLIKKVNININFEK